MKLFRAYTLLILVSLATTSIAIPYYAKQGCNDMCGNVRIPYPFGIGVNCSVNEWYNVDCNSSTPFLSQYNNLEILNVNLENQTVTVNVQTKSSCQNPVQKSMDLGKSPFLFSRSHNMFVVEGCGNAVLMDQGEDMLAGCSTTCRNDSSIDRSNCFGISCCQSTIPHYLKSYSINLTGLERQDGDRACATAFLVDKDSYLEGQFVVTKPSFIPISLLWTLADLDFNQRRCCLNREGERLRVDLGNGSSMDTWKCYSRQFDGTPYLINGCDDGPSVTEECTRCKDSGGHCDYDIIYDIDGLVYKLKLVCHSYPPKRKSQSSLGVVLGISISMGVFSLVASSYVFFKVIKKRKGRRLRHKFFKRNGGLLLQQQQEADPSLVGKTIIFSSHELEKATNNFNENRIIGRGGQGTVYKGMLVDGRIVAVKKSKLVDERQLEQFINEVVILSQVNHRNVVKLLGCCLETSVPLLVSEFISNGTLYEFIHSETDEFPISLTIRLQIATEVAGALAYLHSATSYPIYHRDIKTTNILLDDKYRAKISDFGTSRVVSVDKTHLTTLVKGTFGYLDPEYYQSSQFTEKSDVYSFGVVLLELLTGERPILLNRHGEHISLVTHFMLAMGEGRVMSILKAMLIKEGTKDELLGLANLAKGCLNLNRKYRPTMKEVAILLETTRSSHIPSSN